MKPTKKQITEVTNLAAERGVNINAALRVLEGSSISIYKAIGANGIVETAEEVTEAMRASNEGGVSFNLCRVVTVTEKAFLLVVPGLEVKEVWVAKSVILNDVVPFWAIK